MTNIKDVAKAAGVSTATVSRVLANVDAPIRPETREKVLKAIADLNYRPNLVARSLRAQKTAKIGLVVSDIRNPFFTAIARAVEDAAYEEGYSVLMCNTDENPEKEALYLDVLHDENVAGIIFSPTQQFGANFAENPSSIPFVFIDQSVNGREVDLVLLDNGPAAYDLTQHLLDNGSQKIAGLFGNSSTTAPERHRGFTKALKDHQLTPFATHFIPPRIKHGYETTMNLLAQPDKPDAIFTSNSLLTAGALQAIRSRKLVVPEQIALVGFDETTWGALVEPPITVISQPTEEFGRTATELLFQRIDDPTRAPKTVILNGKLLVRGSSVRRKP
jgi:LacI family fructose operon transcriptional repressor